MGLINCIIDEAFIEESLKVRSLPHSSRFYLEPDLFTQYLHEVFPLGASNVKPVLLGANVEINVSQGVYKVICENHTSSIVLKGLLRYALDSYNNQNSTNNGNPQQK